MRLLISMLGVIAFVATGRLARAGEPETTPVISSPGSILVAKVVGRVTMTVEKHLSVLLVDDQIPPAATIVTGADSTVTLVFSNGAAVRLGSDTELTVERFVQEPFASAVVVDFILEEPSRSQTSLRLVRGDIVAVVKKIHLDRGSSFAVRAATCSVTVVGDGQARFHFFFQPTEGGPAFVALTPTSEGVTLQPLRRGSAAEQK